MSALPRFAFPNIRPITEALPSWPLLIAKMRITTVIGGLGGGGAERVCVNLANAWADRGHHVTILTMAKNVVAPAYAINARVDLRDLGWPRHANSEELNAASIAPVLRGLRQAGCPELIGQITLIALFRHLIHASTPDVVVSHIDMTNLRVLAAMQETGVPVIAVEHTDTGRVPFGPWQRTREALYRHASAVVASHPAIADWLARRGAKAFAIPNPLVAPPQIQVEKNADRRRLVTFARLSREKQIPLLVRAFARLAPDYPGWDFDIYGTGPLHAPLTQLIADLAPGRVHLRGFTADPYAVLHKADLFASASWVEGFGNVIWEALACAVPVVAMECGAPVRSLVRDGIDGLIVPSNLELVPALASLMGDDARRAAFTARAAEVLTRYSIESSLKAWNTLLEKVVVR